MVQVNHKIIFLAIFLIAVCLRLMGVDWDQGTHLHPDERFLNMTVADINLPNSLTEYFNPHFSNLNPRNHDRSFFVYGNAPITLDKLVTTIFNKNSLTEIAHTGRLLSALADLTVIVVIYLTVQLLEQQLKKNKIKIHPHTKLWASLVYTLSVLPIQQAHFFTVDTFANLFIFTSFYFGLQYFFNKKFNSLLLAGLFSGFAIGCKISGIFIIPLNLSLICLPYLLPINLKHIFHKKIIKKILHAFLASSTVILLTYFGVRLSSPYMFKTASLINPTLSPEFIKNITELKAWDGDDVWYPPGVQWINRPVTFGIQNLIFFGLGIVNFSLVLYGGFILIQSSLKLVKNKKTQTVGLMILLIFCWLLGFIGYYALQYYVQSIRYYLIIYPFLAIIASFGITQFLHNQQHLLIKKSLLLLSLFIWPLMFISIYLKPHSRIQASVWVYQNIPAHSYILSELWDDGLPLSIQGYNSEYQSYQLPVFNQDNPQKWQELAVQLAQADYYILASNRGWGSIMRVPKKYPQMSKFYEKLLAGETNYKLVAKFSSYPSLEYLGIPLTINDSWSEEAFTVYDHPEVMIFKNMDKQN